MYQAIHRIKLVIFNKLLLFGKAKIKKYLGTQIKSRLSYIRLRQNEDKVCDRLENIHIIMILIAWLYKLCRSLIIIIKYLSKQLRKNLDFFNCVVFKFFLIFFLLNISVNLLHQATNYLNKLSIMFRSILICCFA